MPDLLELALLLLVGGGVAALIAIPLVRRAGPQAPGEVRDEDLEVLAIRHRVALEAIRDADADWRAGSLDDAAHAEQRERAERRAAETLAELEAARAAASGADPGPDAASAGRSPLSGRRVALAAAVIAAVLVVGLAAPAPFSLANPVQTNQALVQQRAQEAERQATIQRLLAALATNPSDADSLSKLADAYLAGGSVDDLSRGAQILLALLSVDPQDTSAYQRLITAYVNVGDWADAASATDSYAKVAADSPDIPFFRGIIAFRGRNDPAAAIEQFNAFLASAPDDPRATMIRALLAEAQSAAASGAPEASPSPGRLRRSSRRYPRAT